jgi:hypothetical protein
MTTYVINTVLLSGFLTKEKFTRAIEEIRLITIERMFVSLIIASDGGDAVPAVNFIETVKSLGRFEVKIYEASSTAAFIALALGGRRGSGEKREMSKDAILGIHRGEIRLSPSQISPDGKIDEKLTKAFKSYDIALVEILAEAGFNNSKDLMAELYATDWIRLPAEECLKRNIVQRLF